MPEKQLAIHFRRAKRFLKNLKRWTWIVRKYFSQLRGEGRVCIPPAGKWTTPLQGRPPTPVRTETPGILWHVGWVRYSVRWKAARDVQRVSFEYRPKGIWIVNQLRTSHCRDEEGKKSPHKGKHNLQISHGAHKWCNCTGRRGQDPTVREMETRRGKIWANPCHRNEVGHSCELERGKRNSVF